MRRRIRRRNYSNSSRLLEQGVGFLTIPVHLPFPPPLLTHPHSPPPPTLIAQSLAGQQVDPKTREGGGRGRGVTWVATEELVVRKTFRRVDGVIPTQPNHTDNKVSLTLQGV